MWQIARHSDSCQPNEVKVKLIDFWKSPLRLVPVPVRFVSPTHTHKVHRASQRDSKSASFESGKKTVFEWLMIRQNVYQGIHSVVICKIKFNFQLLSLYLHIVLSCFVTSSWPWSHCLLSEWVRAKVNKNNFKFYFFPTPTIRKFISIYHFQNDLINFNVNWLRTLSLSHMSIFYFHSLSIR